MHGRKMDSCNHENKILKSWTLAEPCSWKLWKCSACNMPIVMNLINGEEIISELVPTPLTDPIDWFVPQAMYLRDLVCTDSMNRDKNGKEYKLEYTFIEDAMKSWWTCLVEIENNPQHEGDCTKQPAPCTHCVVSSERREAQIIYNVIEKFAREGFPDE